MAYFLQQLLNGLQIGSVYALLGCGFFMAYGVTRRIDLSFGGLVMWGGQSLILYVAWMAPLFLPLPIVLMIAIITALLANAVWGASVARVIALPLSPKSALATLIATLGLLMILSELARIRASNREIWLAPILSDRIDVGGVLITEIKIANLLMTAVALGLMLLIIRRSHFGRSFRAVQDDAMMARLLGINVTRVGVIAGAFAASLAGLSGIMLALVYGSIDFTMGLMASLKVLFIAILGGLESVERAIVGGLCLGMMETLWSAYFPIAWRDVAVFCVLAGLVALRTPKQRAV